MKKEIYYCDICEKEVSSLDLTKMVIPIINKIYATGGRSNVKLAYMGESLEFEEQELCPACIQIYNQKYTKYATLFAQEWKYQTDIIKNETK